MKSIRIIKEKKKKEHQHAHWKGRSLCPFTEFADRGGAPNDEDEADDTDDADQLELLEGDTRWSSLEAQGDPFTLPLLVSPEPPA